MALHHNPRIVTDGLVSLADTQTPSPSGKVYDPISGGYLTLSNGASVGDQSNGITFDGSNDYASGDSAYSDAFNFGTGDFTLEAWIKQHVAQSGWIVLWSKGSSGSTGFAWMKHSNGVILSTSIDAPNNIHYSNSDATYSSHLGKWLHVATTWDRDGNAKIYFNGEHVATNDISAQNQSVDGATVYIGAWQGAYWFWDGQMDSIKGYNRTLSANEVLQNYNAQRVRFGL